MKHPIVINSNGEFVNKNKWQGILSRAFVNPRIMGQLAQSMIAPIRRNLDYQGFACKVFSVTPLDGEK